MKSIILKRLAKLVKYHFNNSRSSHDWDHTERVLRLAEHIGRVERADLEVIRCAALLHDIGRQDEDQRQGKRCHAQWGARLAPQFLRRAKIPVEKWDKIIHCIATHRYRGEHKPQSLEAKVLYDADKLDSIGATGIGRAFLFAGEVGARLHDPNIIVSRTKSYSREDTAYREFLVKLRFIRNRMLTAEGRRLAHRRHRFMVRFFNELNRETRGFA